MLDLDSPLWANIPASCSMSGGRTPKLIRQIRAGDDRAYDELTQELCHQLTVGEVAYVAVPHLVDIARKEEVRRRVLPLSLIGAVEAARKAHQDAPPIRNDWETEYFAANAQARILTAEALALSGWRKQDSHLLLAASAALHGHTELAMFLFLDGGADKLSCPVCGEYFDLGGSA